MASMQPESRHIISAGSDFPHLTRFGSSKGLNHVMQNWLGSDLDGLVRIWPNVYNPEASQHCKNHRGLVLAELDRYQFPTCRLECILPHTAWIILCQTIPGPIWPNRSGPKQAGVQESSGMLLASASEPIQVRSSTFTGTMIDNWFFFWFFLFSIVPPMMHSNRFTCVS